MALERGAIRLHSKKPIDTTKRAKHDMKKKRPLERRPGRTPLTSIDCRLKRHPAPVAELLFLTTVCDCFQRPATLKVLPRHDTDAKAPLKPGHAMPQLGGGTSGEPPRESEIEADRRA